MNSKKIKCKYCNAIHEIAEELIGGKIQCSDCNNKFMIDEELLDSNTIVFNKKDLFIEPTHDRDSFTAHYIENLLKNKIVSPSDEKLTDDFSISGILGEGGMGIVYQAIQNPIRRFVALKMLNKKIIDEETRNEFIQEAAITAYLDHPHIVPLYDIGITPKNLLFYTMKEIKGASWEEILSSNKEEDNIDILLKVCDALAFAHDKGIIHRDLKPENIMLGNYGEVFLMDWGLAVSYKPELNIPGVATLNEENIAISGSPAFMSPEMANSDLKNIGICSDIYLLGGLLFFILTNKSPHSASEVEEALKQAQNNEIVQLEEEGVLIDIALKALSTNPVDRHLSVKEFQGAIKKGLGNIESIKLAQSAKQDFEKAKKSLKYNDFAQALFGYKEASKLWSDNIIAEAGVETTTIQYAKCAIAKGDFDLSLSLLDSNNNNMQELIAETKQCLKKRKFKHRTFLTAIWMTICLVLITILVLVVSYYKIKDKSLKADIAKSAAIKAAQVAEIEKGKAIVAAQIAKTEKIKAQVAKDLAEESFAKMQLAEKSAQVAKKEANEEKNKAQNALNEAQSAQIAKNTSEELRLEAEKQVLEMKIRTEKAKRLEKRRQINLINSICLNIFKRDFQNAFDILYAAPQERDEWGELGKLLKELKDFEKVLARNVKLHINEDVILKNDRNKNLAKIKGVRKKSIIFEVALGSGQYKKYIPFEEVQIDIIKQICPDLSNLALNILYVKVEFMNDVDNLKKELKKKNIYKIGE